MYNRASTQLGFRCSSFLHKKRCLRIAKILCIRSNLSWSPNVNTDPIPAINAPVRINVSVGEPSFYAQNSDLQRCPLIDNKTWKASGLCISTVPTNASKREVLH
jgi:hypothetical protein